MVVCIARKMSGGRTLEHIVELKWRNTGTGNEDKSSIPSLIEWIENGNTLYCADQRGGSPVVVMVERPVGRRPYLRTKPNGDPYDNLLALPEYW